MVQHELHDTLNKLQKCKVYVAAEEYTLRYTKQKKSTLQRHQTVEHRNAQNHKVFKSLKTANRTVDYSPFTGKKIITTLRQTVRV